MKDRFVGLAKVKPKKRKKKKRQRGGCARNPAAVFLLQATVLCTVFCTMFVRMLHVIP